MAQETGVQSQVESYQKMVLDTFLLNTQNYKVRIRVKWSNPGKGVASFLHFGVVATGKGVFGSTSTTVSDLIHISCALLKTISNHLLLYIMVYQN